MAVDIQPEAGEATAASRFPWSDFRIPPFPESALRVLKSVNDEDASMRQFSDLISADPALSVEVLIIANSALLAQRHRVTSILQASVLLGTHILKGVCLTVAVRACLGKTMSNPSLRAIWRHSLACALISEQLAGTASLDKGTAYTAGVMHEIGRFALAVVKPKEYSALLKEHCGTQQSILEKEREIFGFDHRDAGQHMISEWKLPAEFQTMVHADDTTPRSNSLRQIQELVHISCRMADAAGFTVFPGCEVTPYHDLLELLPVRARSLFYADGKRLAFDLSSKITAIESL
jgi:HD-like signal output (HDOD) protein